MNDNEKYFPEKSIDEKIAIFLGLNKKNKAQEMIYKIYDDAADVIRISVSDIVLLQELYERYEIENVIKDLELLLQMWLSPFIVESYDIASFYKKEMIEKRINYDYNVEELIERSMSPVYLEYFENEYMLNLCYDIVNGEKNKFIDTARKIVSKIEEDNNLWWFNKEEIEKKEYLNLADILENGTLSECFTSFFQLSEEERQKFLREGILEKTVFGGYNVRCIIFLSRLYNCYGYREAICMLEHILSVWYPDYLEESYEMAAFYKRKMIEDRVDYERNIQEILQMENRKYRKQFDDDYVWNLCKNILQEDLDESLKELARKHINKNSL